MDELIGNIFIQGGALTGLLFTILAIVRGWLIPKTTVDRMEAFYVKREDDWRAALTASEAARTTLLAQQQRLLEIAYLARDVVAQQHAEATTDATP